MTLYANSINIMNNKLPFLFKQFLFFLFIIATCYSGCKKSEKKEAKNKQGNNLFVGASANDLLSSNKFKKLVVDLMYMENHAPTATAVKNLENFLIKYLNKPEGVVIKQREIPSSKLSAYAVSDIKKIEDEHREEYNSAETIAVSLFFLDAEYAGNSGNAKVLGIAYRNTSMAVFQKTVKENSGGITQPSRSIVESTIINHEVGHLLGLVDIGTNMVIDHQDKDHGHHCNNKNCLMYYTVETTDFLDNLIGGSVPELDDNCKKDLKANGGK